jgi:predicted ATPase/class 3 adenylate cyclase
MTQSQQQTLTFLYTDIEGSTRLWEHQPEAMRQAVARHDQIMRQAITDNDGRVFRTVGDAFCAVFSAAPQALQAAVDAQRSLAREPWELEGSIRVRMALHTGEAAEQAGDYVGASLNHIGRLIAACHGGQIVLTRVSMELVRDQLPQEVRLTDLGIHRFRDLIHPEHIFQADIDGLPAGFPPLKSLEVHPNNFPSLLTNFIGREQEMETIRQLVASTRLLTLTGPGGTGKTRLSLEVANQIIEDFPDGAWLVELAPLSNPALLSQTVAMVLNVREQPGRSLQDSLIEALHSKRLLLILDNCEHLIDACAHLAAALLSSCSQIKIITSSREMLGIPGEVVHRVPSLSLPNLDGQATFEQIARSEAVRLFVDRAATLRSGFELTPQNAGAIHQICTRLDGIPLAIELAAARITVLGPQQIASRLDDRFRLLTGGSRTVLPRQQTLEALFDWSHELLSEEEQRFFRRLSVFAGGWAFEAAEAVTGSEYTLDLLEQLVNKSLVVVDWLDQGTRYHMLETTRQYAQKKLFEAGEALETRRAHAACYAAYSDQQQFLNLRSFGKLVHLFAGEQENLYTALEWAIDQDLPLALKIGSNLSYYWVSIGVAGEMRNHLHRAIQMARQTPEFQDQHLLVNALMSEGILAINLGQNLEALRLLQSALEQARQLGDSSLLVVILPLLSEAAGLTGDADLAYRSGEEGIAVARKSGDSWMIGLNFINIISYSLIPLGDFQKARQYADELMGILKNESEDVDPWLITILEQVLGVLDFHDGQYERAGAHFTNSMQRFRELGSVHFETVARSGLADVARLQKRYQEAGDLYSQVIQNWRDQGNLGAVARCLECLAFIAGEQAQSAGGTSGQEQLRRAAILLGAAETIRQEQQSGMNPIEQKEYDRLLGQIQAFASQDDSNQSILEQAWGEGQAFRLEDVVRFLESP